MRQIYKAIVLAAVSALLVSGMAFSADYLHGAAEALKNTKVYVFPGTEGTDKDTAAGLQSRLTSDDNIVLVMFPSVVETELGVDINAIAESLSRELSNQRIIGLAIGKKVVGYAPTLPIGVAADQMKRAESVSNDPLTALGTFAQNIHIWQREHPGPQPNQPSEPTNSGPGGLGLIIGIGLVALVVILFFVKASSRTDESSKPRTRFDAPGHVRDLLSRISVQREQVYDRILKDALYQMCVDIERYFRTSSKDKDKDALTFEQLLNQVLQVLDKYIDIQENKRYYTSPDDLLRKGRESIVGFSAYVLESIRRGHSVELMEYNVGTDILGAQRYRF